MTERVLSKDIKVELLPGSHFAFTGVTMPSLGLVHQPVVSEAPVRDELDNFIFFACRDLFLSHVGYMAIVFIGCFFKIALAASLVSYSSFLCAALVGLFPTYVIQSLVF